MVEIVDAQFILFYISQIQNLLLKRSILESSQSSLLQENSRRRWMSQKGTENATEIINKKIEKIRNDPYVIFRGLGEGDSWKNLKEKISWHCPFKGRWQMPWYLYSYVVSGPSPSLSLCVNTVIYLWTTCCKNTCSTHLVRIFSSTPVQFAARQRKVEKETVGRWWRRSVLGVRSAQ